MDLIILQGRLLASTALQITLETLKGRGVMPDDDEEGGKAKR